jgi:hypothetical protein
MWHNLLNNLWSAIQWLAQFWDLIAALVVLALGFRAVVRDRKAYRSRHNEREVVFTLNDLVPYDGSAIRTLCIRTIAETALIDAMGRNNTAAKRLIEAARRVKTGSPVLVFPSVFDAGEICNEVTNELSPLTGPGFLLQCASGERLEVPFIFVVTRELDDGADQDAMNVRVQLILESALSSLTEANGDTLQGCSWRLEHPESPRYQARDKTLRAVIAAYRDWRAGRPGSDRLGIGRVMLVPQGLTPAAAAKVRN